MHSVAEVFQLYGEAYRKEFRDHMPADQLKAMWAIENCRTGKLGVAVYACQQCGKAHSIARSCGNRHCPTCQASKGQRWLATQLSRLLPCPYFFLCFTVPEQARLVMRSHPKECYNILMEAAACALMTLAKDAKYIGSARLSMTAVLHTWGRDLSYNPHVHVVVAGGALSEDGTRWLPSRVDYQVPVMTLSVINRAKVRDALKQAGLLDKFAKDVWKEPWAPAEILILIGDDPPSVSSLQPNQKMIHLRARLQPHGRQQRCDAILGAQQKDLLLLAVSKVVPWRQSAHRE